jgi:hypothetical protein
MTERIIKHYDHPVEFHKSLPGATRIVIMKRDDDGDDDGFTPAVATTAKPINRKPKVRREIDDDDVIIPAEKGNNMSDIDRGPFYKMLDRQALARQQQTGESYAVAFTKIYEAPENRAIRDAATNEHLAQGHDAMFGYGLSAIPVAKAAPAYDPLAKAADLAEHLGPAHARLHSLAIDHMRAHDGMSYQQAYAYLYGKPENAGLREKIKNEHMRATISGFDDDGLDKAAALPMDPPQDDVIPGSARQELHQLVVERMKRSPILTYERSFVAEYLAPANRSLKARYDQESVAHMRSFTPARSFPSYGHPGDTRGGGRVGRTMGREGRGGQDF